MIGKAYRPAEREATAPENAENALADAIAFCLRMTDVGWTIGGLRITGFCGSGLDRNMKKRIPILPIQIPPAIRAIRIVFGLCAATFGTEAEGFSWLTGSSCPLVFSGAAAKGLSVSFIP